MKKFILLIAVLALLSCSATAFAAAEFENIGALYEHWHSTQTDYEKSPYPDYVCGVWSTNGTMSALTVAVTKDEAGEAGKEEILSLIEDDSSVTFTYLSYSHAELYEVKEALYQMGCFEAGVVGYGIYDMENQVVVDIDTANEKSAGFMQKCFDKFGDRIRFDGSDGLAITEDTDTLDIGADVTTAIGREELGTDSSFFWLWLVIMIAAGSGAALIFSRRHASVTDTGDIHTTGETLSLKETEEAVKSGTAFPSKSLDEKILKKIDEE